MERLNWDTRVLRGGFGGASPPSPRQHAANFSFTFANFTAGQAFENGELVKSTGSLRENFGRENGCVIEQDYLLQCMNSLLQQHMRSRTRGFLTAEMLGKSAIFLD